MRRRAIPFPSIAPDAHPQPPDFSLPEVYFRALALLKASVTAIFSGGLIPQLTQIALKGMEKKC
jgi:hypothetical protein